MELEFHDFSLKGLFGKKANPIKQVQNRYLFPPETPQLSPFKDLEYPLLQLSENPSDRWTIADAVRGTQIFGGIGSGKSSGSGKTLALRFLESGFGGLVLCGKPDEKDNWLEYARKVGRENDIIVFSKNSGHEFNPLQYEIEREGEGAGATQNLVTLFMNIFQLGQRINGGEAKESERFWENAIRRCIIRIIDLLKLAGEELSVANMAELLNSAPVGKDYMEHVATFETEEELENWFIETGYCTKCILKAAETELNEDDKTCFNLVYRYFMRDYPKLGNDTRAGVSESFLGIAEPFLTGLLAKQFARGVNLKPEITHEGKIIVLDFPVKDFLEIGIYAQSIFKLMWQQATERRKIINGQAVPVFLWVDESQFFVTEYDMLFQTTARSSRACTVFLTQNISNYYATIGGNHPKAKVDSLLGNLCTKIFHANNDFETNQWAANTIGKTFKKVDSSSTGFNPTNLMPNVGFSEANQLHYQKEPMEFTTLKCGGSENANEVEGYMITAGKKWADGKNYKQVFFSQTQ